MSAGFDIAAIDDVVHGRLRLGVMTILADCETATFKEMKSRLKTTQGNLSVQLRKLEGAGYIEINRRLVGKKTELRARMTEEGRAAFAKYVEAIRRIVLDR